MTTTGVKARVFLDTNIVLRANVITAPLHSEVLAAIRKLRRERHETWISRQVLREYMVNVTRPQNFMSPLSAADVRKRINYLQTRFRVADGTAEVTAMLLTLLENVAVGGKQVHDANIVATMQVNGITQLLTLNTADFVRFSSFITVLSPEEVLKSVSDEGTEE